MNWWPIASFSDNPILLPLVSIVFLPFGDGEPTVLELQSSLNPPPYPNFGWDTYVWVHQYISLVLICKFSSCSTNSLVNTASIQLLYMAGLGVSETKIDRHNVRTWYPKLRQHRTQHRVT
jgi:hypothetical protein